MEKGKGKGKGKGKEEEERQIQEKMDSNVQNCINKNMDLLFMLAWHYDADDLVFEKLDDEGIYFKSLVQCARRWSSNQSSISTIYSAFVKRAEQLYSELDTIVLKCARDWIYRRSFSDVEFAFYKKSCELYSHSVILSGYAVVVDANEQCVNMYKIFKQAIWELHSSVFDSISDMLVCYYHGNDDGLNKLKVELKLLKTFSLCAINMPCWDYWTFDKDFESLYVNGKQFFSPVLELEDGLLYHELAGGISIFREQIQGCKHLICKWYTCMPLLKHFNYPWQKNGDMEFLNSLLENLSDGLILGKFSDTTTSKTLIESMKEKLTYFRNFILLFTLTGLKPIECLEKFAAIDAARLCCMCWFYRDDDQVLDEIKLNISDLVERMMPVNDKFREQYHKFLRYSRYQKLSFTQLVEPDLHAVGSFVDSLICNLRKVLNSNSSITVSMGHEMEMLGHGLKFLRIILQKQQEKLNGLNGETKNLIKDVICDAGHVISSLDRPPTEEVNPETINPQFMHLLGNIEVIKAEFEVKYPAMSTFNFPAINEVEFIDLVLEKLKELARSKVDLIPFGNDQIQKVAADLLSLRSFLENIQDHRRHHDELQDLWSRVIEVAYKAEFAIDSLIARDMSPYSLMLFDNSVKEIRLVESETLKIDDKKYVFQAQKAAKPSSHVPSQATISPFRDEVKKTAEASSHSPLKGPISPIKDAIVGFDVEAEEIIALLIGGFKRLEIVSIVGMPGLGKTTLAKKVYHDSSVVHHFHIRVWCSVSQVWCRKDLLIEILHCIVPEHSNQDSEESEDDLSSKLRQRLKKKKYLIVLDDVWDIEVWNALGRSFPNDATGSRILLTGRHNLFIEPIVKAYPLRRRTDDECWELLQKKQVYKVDFSPSICNIGRRIAKNCNGLPLSVVIIAGILASLEQDGWEEVAMSSNIVCGTEECMNVLDLSYRHLPDYLKPCLLYFGAFPEDQEIPTDKLMWLWIAEGFLQKNELKSLEGTAEDCIMALIGRNLVMVAKEGSLGRVKTCRIHDLLHEFCKVKSKEQNFLHLMHGENDLCDFDAPKLRRLYMHCQPTYFVNWRLFYPQIRSLLFFPSGAGNRKMSYNLHNVFRRKLLAVLDLGQVNIGLTFPCEVTMLVQLRYLAIQGWMKDVPASIINLLNLETFLVTRNLSALSGFSMPNTLWNMQKLRHLHVNGGFVDLSLGTDNLENTSNLDNLDTFSTPKLYLGHNMEKTMRKFPNIRKLKCSLAESEESNVDSNKIVVINFPSRLESLKLFLGNVDVLHVEFNFPLSLRKLTLADFSWSMMSTIKNLPNLEVLKLLSGAVNEIGTWEMEEEEFPNLKILKLEYSNIVSWTSSNDEHFPCLQKLVLEGCRKLEMLPSCLEDISTLDLIKVHRCSDYVGDLVREIENIHKSWGNEGLKILITEEFEVDLYYED